MKGAREVGIRMVVGWGYLRELEIGLMPGPDGSLVFVSVGAHRLISLVSLGNVSGLFLDKPTLVGLAQRPSLLRSPLIWGPKFGDTIAQLAQFRFSTRWAYSTSSSSILGITNRTSARMLGLNPLMNTPSKFQHMLWQTQQHHCHPFKNQTELSH